MTIRTEGGVGVGLGHLRRTATLARALALRGIAVHFLLDPRPGGAEFLQRLGVAASILLDGPEPDRTLAAVGRVHADALVTDSYALTAADLHAFRDVIARLVCIDDLASVDLPGHIVTNGAPYAEELPYRRRPDTRYLLGAAFALVDGQFAPQADGHAGRMFLILGGGGDAGAVRMLAALDELMSGMSIVWVRGPLEPEDPSLTLRRNLLEIHRDPPNPSAVLAGCAFGVSAGGQTALELAAMGMPFIGVRAAENQRHILSGLHRWGACVDAGAVDDPEQPAHLERALRLMQDAVFRAAMRRRGPLLIDGYGPRRVVEAMLS